MELETYYRIVTALFTGITGLCIGSFLNVVIYRLPLNMSLSNPPSHCTNCDYTLRWYDNIPVFSYLFLKGRCRKCHTRISPRYICVEILNAILWLCCFFRFGIDGWQNIISFVASAIACSVCICIAFIDFEHHIIFDRFQIILLVLGIAFTVADRDVSALSHIIAAFTGGIMFWLIGYTVSHFVGREALGGGDIKFAFVSGLFLGIGRFLLFAIVSSVTACIMLILLKNKNNNPEREYPFGPFLTAGFVVSLLFGTSIIDLYLHIFGLE